MGVLVGVRQAAVWLGWVLWDVGLGNLVEDEDARLRCRVGAAAEIAGGDAGLADGCDGVVGEEFAAWTAVAVHIGEDADDGGVAGVD